MKNTNTRNQRSAQNGRSANGRRQSPSQGKAKSSIDHRILTKSAVESKPREYHASETYEEGYLCAALKKNLADKGYKYPTEIQEATLEDLLEGRNLVGVANTGTGKTGAFLIPIIERLLAGNEDFYSLVVVPTRELALQVEEEFKSLTRGTHLKVTSLIGGTSVGKNIDSLRRKNHLIVGTPGRLMDMANRGSLDLGKISVLILDEFDRMLDMGFVHEIKRMVAMMKHREQTMLFSATIDNSQKALIAQMVKDPVHIRINTGQSSANNIEQRVINVNTSDDKFNLLLDLLSGPDFEKVILFAETKRLVDRLSKKLERSGVTTGLIHGNKSQNFRNKAIQQFKDGNTRVLVATDVAARGIDIDDVSHVINYQVPMTTDSYLHRIGRTGRAGKKGMAYTFVERN